MGNHKGYESTYIPVFHEERRIEERTLSGESNSVISRVKPILGGKFVEAFPDLHSNTICWVYSA